MKDKKFILALFLFFILIFISPNRIVYLLSFLICGILFSYIFKNIPRGLTYVLILAIFFDVGFASSLFKMDPAFLELGSLYSITSQTIVALILLPFTIVKPFIKFKTSDIAILGFFLWLLLTYIFYPHSNIFFGLIQIFEIILIYYIFRTNLKLQDIKYINYIIISVLLFQIILAFLQFIFKRNLGLVFEASTYSNPFGVTTAENINVFRVPGSFEHPNILAAVLVSLFPILYFLKKNIWIILLFIFTLIFSYSRIAWIIFAFTFTYLFFSGYSSNKLYTSIRNQIAYILITAVLIYSITPFFLVRSESISYLFAPNSSLDIRLKLLKEGFNIMSKYPLTGIGLNNSLLSYIASPVTDLFNLVRPSFSYRLHNMFLEIGAETGLVGLIIFLIFLLPVLFGNNKRKKQDEANVDYGKSIRISLLTLIILSMVNPFFHSMPFRLYFLYISILLI